MADGRGVASEEAADVVLTGGRVVVVDPDWTVAEAIAIRAGRITDLGTAAEVAPTIGRRTRVIDLRGRTVLPGFRDAHVHPVHGGLAMARCDLHDLDGEEAYLDAVRRYASANPDEAWIRGGGWAMDDFPGGNPSKRGLDAVVPDRPVFLPSRDVHSAWVNSRALELAGITAATADPADGVVVRDATGSPAGTLHEGAMELVRRVMPDDTAADVERALAAGQRYLHAFGITGWQDAMVTPQIEAAYRALGERDELTGRVVGALWWERERGGEQVEELVARRGRGAAGRFRPSSVKMMQDGVLENFTGALLEPYLDGAGAATGSSGLSFIEPGSLSRYVTELDARGFQVHFHAIGDRAVREALDALAAARGRNGITQGRHHVSHLQLVHPDDIPRFAALGVTATIQPLWAVHEPQMDELTIPFLGAERAARQYPFASLAASGALLAGGSDWPVSTPDPLRQIEVAVTRVAPESRGRLPPFLPEQRLSLPAALHAFTAGAARVDHLDTETGTLERGRLADLVVLDRDLFDRGGGHIGDARVVATYIEGETVYESPDLEG